MNGTKERRNRCYSRPETCYHSSLIATSSVDFAL
jgi:hypothetical protein